MVTEKKLITELLQLYQNSPSLWDTRQFIYTKKEARDHAYEVLLEKYRQIYEEANIADLKRKIEHMRAAYRREHKKVLLSRIKGDGNEYTPTLWYYDLMTFLNDVSDFSRLTETSSAQTCDADSNADSELKPRKRGRKRKIEEPSAVYLPEELNFDLSEDRIDNTDEHSNNTGDEISRLNSEELNMPIKEEEQQIQNTFEDSRLQEFESFGTTIGLQLKDIDPVQRMIAEKLISDVIFDARFHKLTVNSRVVHYS